MYVVCMYECTYVCVCVCIYVKVYYIWNERCVGLPASFCMSYVFCSRCLSGAKATAMVSLRRRTRQTFSIRRLAEDNRLLTMLRSAPHMLWLVVRQSGVRSWSQQLPCTMGRCERLQVIWDEPSRAQYALSSASGTRQAFASNCQTKLCARF